MTENAGQTPRKGLRGGLRGILGPGALVLGLIVGFVLGRLYGERRPIQFIGRPVEYSTDLRVSIPTNETQPAAEATCNALTLAGTRCKRKVQGGGHCWQHGGGKTRR